MNDHQKQRDEWLASLKPGDEVALGRRSAYDVPSIEKIGRMTATQIIVGRLRFRRSDGRLVGDPYALSIEPASEAVRELIRRYALSRWLSSLTEYGRAKNNVTTAQLVAMKTAFDAAGEKPCKN